MMLDLERAGPSFRLDRTSRWIPGASEVVARADQHHNVKTNLLWKYSA